MESRVEAKTEEEGEEEVPEPRAQSHTSGPAGLLGATAVIRLHLDLGADRSNWFIFVGQCVRTQESRSGNEAVFEIREPDLSVTIRSKYVMSAPSVSASGRLPAGFVEQLLQFPPVESSSLGLRVHGALVPAERAASFQKWHGYPVGGEQDKLTELELRRVERNLGQILPEHAWGRAAPRQGRSPGPSGPVVRVQTATARLDRSRSPGTPRFQRRAPTPPPTKGWFEDDDAGIGEADGVAASDEYFDVYIQARQRGLSDQEALQSVAAGFGEDVGRVKLLMKEAVARALEHAEDEEEVKRLKQLIAAWTPLTRARSPLGKRLLILPQSTSRANSQLDPPAEQTPRQGDRLVPTSLVTAEPAVPVQTPLVPAPIAGAAASLLLRPRSPAVL